MAKSRYTYDQFRKAAQDSGLWGQFSQADLLTAQQTPDFGMSILKTKQDYQNATTDEARAAAHRQADALRSSWGGYTGGGDGGSFVLDPMSPRNFEYEAAPTYESRYDDTIQDLIAGLLDRPDFSYDPATDPLYQNYRKQYTREGQRATADALGAAAAASGGIPSSYANAAANQASNYYAAQLTDKIPDLYQLAYNQYLNDYNMDLSNLGVVQGAEQSDYDKYLNQLNQYNTDRNFSYGQFLDELSSQNQRRTDALNEAVLRAEMGDYGGLADRRWDTSNIPYEWEKQQSIEQQNYEREQALRELAQAQVDNMLQTGTMPPAELLQQSGYSQDYANALGSYYKNQLAQQANRGRSIGGGKDRSGNQLSFSEAKKLAENGYFGDEVLSVLRSNGYFDAAITAMYGWEPTKSGGPTAGSEQVTNRTDEAASDWIHVPGFGRLTYPELEHYVDTGAIIESYDERTGKYTYRKA